MTAQIRPNRMEVSDRFPMLGFAVRTDQPDVEAEVVIASDIGLFSPQKSIARTAANFYSSREHGSLRVPRGEGVFVVPPEVLARFIGNDRLFFGLATGRSANGGLHVDALPREGSPYVSLRGFTGRTLRRGFGSAPATTPKLEWTGDAPAPGSESPSGTAQPASTAGNGGGTPQPVPAPYDDGFGPMPEIPARESSYRSGGTRGMPQRGYYGHSMSEGADPALIDFPEGSVRMGPIIEPAAVVDIPPAAAMVAGAEDYDKARLLARDFTDVFTWTAPAAVVSSVNARGFSIQPIHAATGDLSLDFYKVDIQRFPDGWDAPRLLETFITGINSFVDTGNTEFIPYDEVDRQTLASANKAGTAFKLDIVGPDNAAIVLSDHQVLSAGEYYAVTTIETPWGGSHPVSGHRQFGYYRTGDAWVFYTRGADRSTAPVPGTEWMIWQGAEALWQSFQSKLAAFINENGGQASIRTPFSERFNATAVRLTYGNFDEPRSSGMARVLNTAGEPADAPAFVPPPVPFDPRQRARRIGGEFGPRIGEALDLGLEPSTLTPLLDTLDSPLFATPQSYTRRHTSKAMNAPVWSINWDDVDVIGQPTNVSCWATSASLLIGWRDRQSIAPDTIASQCGMTINEGLSPAVVETIAAKLGLHSAPAACYAPEGFRALIENNGPLWVGKMMTAAGNSGHVVLVVGMYSDGTDHFLRIVDPWDRPVGTPGAPGNYGSSHTTGSRYIMRYEDFQLEYEMVAAVAPSANVLILHTGGAHGHIPNTNTTPPAGFAMAQTLGRALQTAPPFRSRAQDAVAIAGIAIDVVSNSSGDIKTNLANWSGIKHPNDVAPDTQAAFQSGEVQLRDWPVVGGTFGLDDIYCWLKIRWQYNGTSLGRIYIDDDGHNDAAGWGLTVNATIEDDSRLYARSSQGRLPGPDQVPALHININYTFDEVIADDQIASSRVSLYADGTYEVSSRWVQHSRPGGGNPTIVTRPFGLAHNDARRVPAGALVAPVVIPVGEAIIAAGSVIAGAIASASGTDITYQVDSYRGFKRPRGTDLQAPWRGGRVERDKVTIEWDDGGVLDAIGLKLDITWEFDGWSLGNVVITPHGFNDAVGDALFVRAEIAETEQPFIGVNAWTHNNLYKDDPGAMLRVIVTYRRERMARGDVLEEKEIFLLPNGQYTETEVVR